MNNFLAAFGVFGLILLVVLFFVLGPMLSILAVNQLFGTTIAFTFLNWLCVAWLHIVVASVGGNSKS